MSAPATAPETFRRAVESLAALRPRPEIELAEMRPPQRLAPWSAAWSAEVVSAAPAGEPEPDVLVTGRLVLLHDPEGQEAWDGTLRLVTFVRAELDPEHANDPMLPEVAWSWLTGALEESGAHATAVGGTVTQTSSVRFGDISGPAQVCDLELRASWTPVLPDGTDTGTDTGVDAADLTEHGTAFTTVLATAAGLPPVGVATLGARRLG
ncbi:DUF3000 domain-containing protein [Actinomycetospora corticicola]|uniref:DUF3000 family protein n=1 Tax=Actinomycetospora corticicola TaxID=663602 RepID=A0A7Y9DVD0_9PSEU|nr:hypothetical protein [Actinomycetospora corticicola]